MIHIKKSVVLLNCIVNKENTINSCNVQMGTFPEKDQFVKSLIRKFKEQSDISIRKPSLFESLISKFNTKYTPKDDFIISAYLDGRYWQSEHNKGGELYAKIQIKNTKNNEIYTIENSVIEPQKFNNILPQLIDNLFIKIMEILK